MEKLDSMRVVRCILFFSSILIIGSCSKEPKYDLYWRWIELGVGWVNNLDESVEIDVWEGGLLINEETVVPGDTLEYSYGGQTPNPYWHIQNLIPCAVCPDSLTIEIKDTCFKASLLNPNELMLGWDNADVDTDSVHYVTGYFSIDSTAIQNALTWD